jgi:hypothetical protein
VPILVASYDAHRLRWCYSYSLDWGYLGAGFEVNTWTQDGASCERLEKIAQWGAS